MPRSIVKKYSNDEVTVVWQPALCIHSGVCARGLAEVFQPRNRPWIVITAAPADRIIDQVKQCPSGALSFIDERVGVSPAVDERQDRGR